MARAQFDSDYIFGIHEPGGEHVMLAADHPGWVLFCEAIGHDPNDHSGIDFTTFSDQGLGVMCRLDNGYEPDGTLPFSRDYENFARRVANFVAVSRGCKTWIIGNEMNYAVARPGIQIDWSRHATRRSGPAETADPMRRGLAVRFNVLPDHSTEIRTTRGAVISPGELITPERYARCYRLCREAIHRLPGHSDDLVLVGAVAPWNTQTIYADNPNGDWVQYFYDILAELGAEDCDGFTLHAYTQGPDPELVTSDAKLAPPFQNYHSQFRTYRDFLNAVPAAMRQLPAFITETDQITPWRDVNSGWVRRAYAEIQAWNQQAVNQPIRALVLYRWPRMDKWFIDGKAGVIEDFHLALQNDYRWRTRAAEPPQRAPEVATPQPEAAARTNADPAPDPVAPTSAPAAGGRKRKNNMRTPASPPTYAVEWVADRFPQRMLAGQTITVPLTLRNNGSLTWTWGGGNPFRLGYHYYRGRRRLEIAPNRDLRTDLAEDVPPGASVTVNAHIALPEEAGNYTIELDLIHEGIGWFKEQQSPVLTRWLTVEAPSELPVALGTDVDNGDSEGANAKRNLPVPLFLDIATRLPRSGAYARRSLNQIGYLVISHTGAHPWLSLERIAQSHIAHGYPGIVYDFYVDPTGQVLRVSAMEDVAQPDQIWSEQGVNICLAGNFSITPPPLTQLEATGRLCAWLAQNLGLTAEKIVGLGELTQKGDSPGATFYRNATWKQIVVRQVQLHLAALSHGAEDHAPDDALVQALAAQQAENERLRLELARAEEERARLRTFNERLQIDVADLHREMEAQSDGIAPRLRIQNLIEQLPRDAQRYVERRAEDVQYIVINHTGVPATVTWLEIARAHTVDWPGILYDFCIDGEGDIYQMQPLDEVVETDQVYLSQAINIAFAGEFNRAAPTEEQIHAGSRLIAWLLERFPQVTQENIRGLSEFIEHTSPGEQWLTGKRWKEALLAAVRRASGLVDPTVEEKKLRRQVAEIEEQLEAAQQISLVQQQQKAKLEEENHRLKLELADKSALTRGFVIPPPSLRNITDQLPRHPTLRYERRSLSQITHIAIHHTAAPPTLGPARIAELHIAADPGRGKEAWPGIGYHYFIHSDGAIEQTNPLEAASYHVYRHNGYAVGVVLAGSFMNGKIPTTAQLRSAAHVTAWLMQELQIPLARVWGHREFPENTTVCPGSEWTGGNRWRDLLFERIEQIQNGIGVKSIRHYLLFWQRDFPGPLARQDLINAIGYITRFRPAVGFALEDAKYAEYVTIVGGEAGISANDEKYLRNHGCQVERVAGRDEDETSRLLAEMVRQNRRFQNFDVDF